MQPTPRALLLADQDNHLWWQIVPQSLILLAAVGGLLALCGVAFRGFATVAFWVLFAGMLAQGIAASVLYLLADGGGMREVLEMTTHTAINRGTLVWMLGVFTIADLGKIRALEAA